MRVGSARAQVSAAARTVERAARQPPRYDFCRRAQHYATSFWRAPHALQRSGRSLQSNTMRVGSPLTGLVRALGRAGRAGPGHGRRGPTGRPMASGAAATDSSGASTRKWAGRAVFAVRPTAPAHHACLRCSEGSVICIACPVAS
jgi:hypothetical protein